ncbi:MFS transporter, partial [Vibrio parahaemolyticus]|nr:MFS transporter [Vibrio parahaemolyticus]
MFDMIINPILDLSLLALSQLYLLTFYYASVLSFLSGLISPTIYFDKPEKNEKGSVLRRLFIFIAVLLFCFGTLSNFTVPAMINALQQHYFVALSDLVYPVWAYLYLPLFLLGISIHVALRRAISPRLNKLKQKMTKKTTMARDERTDVRTVKAFLPETVQYDPEKYI